MRASLAPSRTASCKNLTHLVIEGMILAGLVTGARKGILYIRHEYEPQEHLIADEIRRCYEAGGLLGPAYAGRICNLIWSYSSAPADTFAVIKRR